MNRISSGFSLLEVLITIVILSFGLLGVAGLQSRYLAAEMESFQRSQALILVNDIASRLAGNRFDASTVTDPPYVTASPLGTGDAPATPCPATPIYARDKCEWSKSLLGAAEKSVVGTVTTNLGAMVGARGCVELLDDTPPTYRVSVAWQGLTATKAPDLPCGKDAYGDDAFRRVVSYRVVIPKLLD